MRSVLMLVMVTAGVALAVAPAGAVAASRPVVGGVSPAFGAAAGGTTVTISGAGFSHVRKVLFGSAAGTSVSVKSGTKLTVRAPQHPTGTVNVRVETSAGTSAETSKDHYTYKSAWTATEAPLPAHAADPQASLTALACGSSGSCLAAGSYLDAKDHRQGLVERLAGGRWSAATAPVPAKADSVSGADLTSVACPTSSLCVVVGSYVDRDNHDNGVIDTLSGGIWTAKQAPLPTGVAAGSTVQLMAVACHGTGTCAAVGTYLDSGSHSQGLLETLTNGAWSATKAPLPNDATPDQNALVQAVACPAVGSCRAVGDYDNPEQVGVVETLHNGAWHAAEANLPAGADPGFQNVILASVSCASTTACTAVGQYLDSAPRQQGLIESLPVGGTSGAEAGVPADGNPAPDIGLAAVSCVPSGCTAVGTYSDKTPAVAGLIEPLTGPTGPKHAPLPTVGTGAPLTDLVSTDCSASDSCAAVGFFLDPTEHYHGLIEALSATKWHGAAAALPANAFTATTFTPVVTELTQVACPSKTTCVSVGQYADKHGHQQGLIEDQ